MLNSSAGTVPSGIWNGNLIGLYEAIEFIIKQRGERSQTNGAIVFAEDDLGIERDCGETEVRINGELVLSFGSIASSQPRFFDPGNGGWVRRLYLLGQRTKEYFRCAG